MSKSKVAGVHEDLEVFDDKLTITPRGLMGALTKGLKGTKTIPFRSITALQHKKAGFVFSGYLQFTIPGGNESRAGVFAAASDENTFMYAGTDKNAEVEEIKLFIERRMGEVRDGAGSASVGVSAADELAKLAQLRVQGILTEEEFAKAKSRLLGL